MAVTSKYSAGPLLDLRILTVGKTLKKVTKARIEPGRLINFPSNNYPIRYNASTFLHPLDMLSLFSTLLSILTLLPLALSTPITNSPTTDLTTTTADQNTVGGYPVDKKRKCYSYYVPWNRMATRNCIDALHKLPPSTRTAGTFHYGGHYDAFKLPVSGQVGDCVVSVDLVDSNKFERSTWEAVNKAASDLIFGCALDPQKYWAGPTVGGKYRIADNDNKDEGILVKVKKTAPRRSEAEER